MPSTWLKRCASVNRTTGSATTPCATASRSGRVCSSGSGSRGRSIRAAAVRPLQIAEAAGERGVDVVPLGRCALTPLDVAGLVLGFAAVEPRAIRRGIDVLASVIEGV
jgi:hypothetical protein